TAPRGGYTGRAPQQAAWLQYTSGTTRTPRAVMVSGEGCVANVASIAAATGAGPGTVICLWLPLFHDMGLITGLLTPALLGCHCVFMPPLAFLRRPALWLAAIGHYRASVTVAPSFALDLCVEKVSAADAATLDLSSLCCLACGAEVASPGAMRRFVARFGAQGAREGAFFFCYGLAEFTVFASGSPCRGTLRCDPVALRQGRAVPAPNGVELLPSGRPGPGTTVTIVGPGGEALGEDEVGEIVLHGPSRALGYWHGGEDDQRAFHGPLPGGSPAGLRTSDLGFMHQGQLVVLGRLQEAMDIGGQRYLPQDFARAIAGRVKGVDRNAITAATTAGGPTAYLEARRGERDPQALAAAAREAITQGLHLLARVVVVRPFGIPRTTSGKIQQQECVRRHARGELPTLAELAAPGETTN
nr:AMP-binding protein [Succinivibrionaceae bacterium]